MSGQRVRFVNTIPLPKVVIKEEILSEDDEEVHCCKICSKRFVSPMALRNHAMMEHYEAFATGDPSEWTDPFGGKQQDTKTTKGKLQKVEDQSIEGKTKEFLSSMAEGKITSLASPNVDYIIIKDGDLDIGDRKRKRLVKVDKPIKDVPAKRSKEPQVITGPFECVESGSCHRIFFSCCEYSTHYRDEHTRRRKGLRCQVCEKPLSPEGESPFPYMCDVCGVGFNASKELSEHVSAAHVKLRPYQCEVCPKRFTQQAGVQQHMRMHTGDRPFSCTYCPKAFTQKSGLDQHLRIHTKVKPYRCVICTKAFCQSIHLKQHMRTHTNVSPFQCGICSQRFKQSSHLNYHLRNHNPAKMTEEQKIKYAELIGMMGISSDAIEVEVTPLEDHELEEVETEETIVTEEISNGISQEEQQAAEQSVEVWDKDVYVLSEEGQEKWTVQLVE
ncbi:unnamed protein product [Chilo suppressalis]|uniref:C2H2-type domain-containing protein n=1 Tax=Chilo suppressalis TaxID=168631 RepID=A0ABN8BBS0_CHISP|nr:unnamed protein product [Chilo suppressalis]